MHRFKTLLFILYIMGCYIDITLYITRSLFVPYAISNISGFILFILNFNFFLRNKNLRRFYFLFITVSVVSIVFSPNNYAGILKEQLISLIQLILSMAGGIGVYIFLTRKCNQNKVYTILKILIVLLIIGGLCERFLPFVREISDNFRYLVFKKNIYINDVRDMLMAGFVRPKFFSREPSFYSQYLTILPLFWYMMRKKKPNIILFACICVLGILISGSPKVVLLIPMLILLDRSLMRRLQKRIGLVFPIIYVIGFVILICIGWFLLNQRVMEIISGSDQSFYLRIIFPFECLKEVLLEYPFFGLGLGGKENMIEILSSVLYSKGYSYIFHQKNILNQFHNFLISAILYHGIIGSFLLVSVVHKTILTDFRHYDKFIFWGILFLFSLMGSSMVGNRAWMEIMIFLALYNNYWERGKLTTPVRVSIGNKQQSLCEGSA